MTESSTAELDVIAVGAHPDDVEIAIGGTLAMLVKQGYRVGIIDLTDGEPTPASSGPEERMLEAKNAAEILGVQVRETLPLPNRRLFDSFEARVELAKVFRRFKPKLVLGIADRTPMASPDHWQARQITDAAVFYSRLTKWDDKFDHLPVHAVSHQLWYPLGFGTLKLPDGPGSFLVDISETLDQKIASVRAYASQFPVTKERIFKLVEAQAILFGQSAGVAAAEMLISPKPVVVRDLMKTFTVEG